MSKKLILTTALTISVSSSVLAMPQSNSVDEAISHLKTYLAQYNQWQKNPIWVDKFQHFLIDKIVNTDEKTALIKAACAPFEKETYYQNCISGSLSFYTTAIGLDNAIDYFGKNCTSDSTQGDCPLYKRMLNQDISQLKFILKL